MPVRLMLERLQKMIEGGLRVKQPGSLTQVSVSSSVSDYLPQQKSLTVNVQVDF